MNLHITRPDRATTSGRDPMRWMVAALVALALFGIGAIHTYVLMFRRGEDLLSALVEAGGMILLAAIPIGYLVYRFWFAEYPFSLMKPLKGFSFDSSDDDDALNGDLLGPQGNGLYVNGVLVWEDHD